MGRGIGRAWRTTITPKEHTAMTTQQPGFGDPDVSQAPVPPGPLPQAPYVPTDVSSQPQQPVAPPGYYYGSPPVQKQSTNGLAIASMVLGIVWIYWIGSILALVFGYIAKKQISQSNGREGGAGMATAGIVLGWIGVGVVALIIVVAILSAAFGHSNG
jgi:Domain of unknown function (DUF4190)